tara:strand:+ start:499 stop:750 length:252 start_codon:yes stop_codon:yes gene_type:complete
MVIHKELTPVERAEFKQWARDNFKFFNSKDFERHINSTWHPVVQQECKRMRDEYQMGLKLRMQGLTQKQAEEYILNMRNNYDD